MASIDKFKVADDEVGETHESSICSMSLAGWTALDKTTLAKQYGVFAVDDEKPISTIIRAPNASDEDHAGIIKLVNGTRTTVAQQFFLGMTLVGVGEIRVINNNGQYEIVGPGRYRLKIVHRCFAGWGQLYSLVQDIISDGPLTIVRVRRGQLGLAAENGRPVILSEGLHVYNSPLFSFVKFVPMDAEYIQHMSYNVIRVPKGMFGKIFEQGRAKLLPEGLHAMDNPVFKYMGLVSTRDPYINNGSIHIVQVPKGSMGLVFESGFPVLLQEGLHIYDSPTLDFAGIRTQMDSVIQHGTITRFRIQKGEVGLAWLDNQPLLIEDPGTYQVNSSSFRFEKVVLITGKLIRLGAKKVITVNSGEVGVSYNRGTLEVLQPGRHHIDSPEHIFDDFMSTQQRSLRLVSESKDGRGQKRELMVCETKDLVSVGIRADVFFRVAQPEQAIMQVGREGIESLVMETSIATLTNIMRSTALNDIAQSALPSAVSEQAVADERQAAQALGAPSAPMFFDKAHDLFLGKLHDDFMKRYGLEITNIRIEQFKIMDDALAQSISQQAVTTAETQSKLANLEGQTQIATQQQERDGRLRQIQAESEAQAQRTKANAAVQQAEAHARAQQVQAEADANQLRVRAEAEAAGIRIRAEATVAEAEAEAKGIQIRAEASISEAKANAESIRLKAEAEASRAKLLSGTPLGEKLALLDVYSEAVKSSNEGVEKVVYVDTNITQANSPFALLSLQQMQTDLWKLSGGGTASGGGN